MSLCSDMEDDNADKSNSSSLLLQRQKWCRFKILKLYRVKIRTMTQKLSDLSSVEKLTLTLNKVCLYENRFLDITSTLDGIVNTHETVAKIETVVEVMRTEFDSLNINLSIDLEARSRRNNLIFNGLAE